ncbi:hypothetical protein SAMN04515618_101246 [Collimonas sp. OK307]|nr:hypothetical protein SAMN04515618_101246 [Collimonas sp. OK307]
MVRKSMCVMLLALSLNACAYRPFQPNPPMYELYVKDNATESDVKAAMLKCGYPSIAGGSRGNSSEVVAKRENCMFENGFKYRDGYKGICSLQSAQNTPACQSDVRISK